ncbi:hypothetical protein [Streptomyces sp. NPDC086023]|uniref:hypothetical protein n=1 Tax=Streptomyces sp. NPDC086023 TaxID=3365746 RepID=UPI0037D65188
MTKAPAVVAAVLVAAVATLAPLAANAATSHDRRPGPLDAARADPWPWVYGLFARLFTLGRGVAGPDLAATIVRITPYVTRDTTVLVPGVPPRRADGPRAGRDR